MLGLALPGSFSPCPTGSTCAPSQLDVPYPPGFAFTQNTGSLGAVVSAALPYVMAFAGLILFGVFIAGGFLLLTSTGNADQVKKGQGMIVNALIGFVVLFISYWLMQILEIVLGIKLGFS